MRRFVLVTTVFVALVTTQVFAASYERGDAQYQEGFTLLKAVHHSTIVVIGTVERLEYSYRENIPGAFTTDVVINIEKLIKGEANLGKKRVIFMIQGGRGISRHDGEMIRLNVSSEPSFEVGERVMLFLQDASGSDFYANYPYNGLHLFRDSYGKRKIVDNKLMLKYPAASESNHDLKLTELPLDLAVKLAMASLKDKESAQALEGQIKTLVWDNTDTKVILSESLVEKLINESQKILDKKEE